MTYAFLNGLKFAVRGAVFALVLLTTSFAFASSARITLKTGVVTEAEVVQLEFGKQVTIRLADGKDSTIPWSEIANVEMLPEPAAREAAPTTTDQAAPAEVHLDESPAAPEPAPATTEPTPAAAKPALSPAARTATPAQKAHSFERLLLVEREIDKVKEDRPGLGGPIALMATGYPLAVVFFADGISMTSTCTGYSCGDMAAPTFAFAGLSLLTGIIGTAWLSGNLKARARSDARLEQLEQERDKLRIDLQTSSTGAVGTVTVSF